MEDFDVRPNREADGSVFFAGRPDAVEGGRVLEMANGPVAIGRSGSRSIKSVRIIDATITAAPAIPTMRGLFTSCYRFERPFHPRT